VNAPKRPAFFDGITADVSLNFLFFFFHTTIIFLYRRLASWKLGKTGEKLLRICLYYLIEKGVLPAS